MNTDTADAMGSSQRAKHTPRSAAIVDCLIPPVATLVLGFIVVKIMSIQDPRAFGEALGRLACMLSFPSAVAGVAIYKGWKKLGWVLVSLSTAGAAAVLLIGVVRGQPDEASRIEFAAGANDVLVGAGIDPFWTVEGDTLVARPPSPIACTNVFAGTDHPTAARFFRALRCVDPSGDQTVVLSR